MFQNYLTYWDHCTSVILYVHWTVWSQIIPHSYNAKTLWIPKRFLINPRRGSHYFPYRFTYFRLRLLHNPVTQKNFSLGAILGEPYYNLVFYLRRLVRFRVQVWNGVTSLLWGGISIQLHYSDDCVLFNRSLVDYSGPEVIKRRHRLWWIHFCPRYVFKVSPLLTGHPFLQGVF